MTASVQVPPPKQEAKLLTIRSSSPSTPMLLPHGGLATTRSISRAISLTQAGHSSVASWRNTACGAPGAILPDAKPCPSPFSLAADLGMINSSEAFGRFPQRPSVAVQVWPLSVTLTPASASCARKLSASTKSLAALARSRSISSCLISASPSQPTTPPIPSSPGPTKLPSKPCASQFARAVNTNSGRISLANTDPNPSSRAAMAIVPDPVHGSNKRSALEERADEPGRTACDAAMAMFTVAIATSISRDAEKHLLAARHEAAQRRAWAPAAELRSTPSITPIFRRTSTK
mmetsp:Transcript_150559/g.484109  ORF Transcript_150559/g.484109 Transcript_150559/m.484109 type:complete len:290 (+) Transcript_150559:145-1014(+)